MGFYNYCYNYILLNIFKDKYSHFPKINGRLIRWGSGKLIFGQNILIHSSIKANPVGLSNKTGFYISKSAFISIGNNVGISNSLFSAIQSIVIENNVMIGGGCQIFDNDFHSMLYSERIGGTDQPKSSPVTIKEGAFIGTSSIILKGVTVGERSVVAAGSVVTKSIPSDEMWGGNPAKYIKNIN